MAPNRHSNKKPNPQSGPQRLAAFLHGHQKQLAITAAALCVVIAGTLTVLAFALPGGDDSTSVAASSATGSAVASSTAAQSVPEEEEVFVPTVLPETEDAGLEYAQETLFLGDSNTERMLYYSDVTGVTVDNGYGVVGMGISTFTTTGVARFVGQNNILTMPQVVELLQPRRVVMTFGTNNVGMNVERFIADYKTAVAAVKSAYQYADIIIGSIFPVEN